jgi:hypothetical protein
MFRRVMLDAKILRKLFSIMRGKRIRHKRPEANNASIISAPKREKRGDVLVEYLPSADPFRAPAGPIGLEGF